MPSATTHLEDSQHRLELQKPSGAGSGVGGESRPLLPGCEGLELMRLRLHILIVYLPLFPAPDL